MLLGELVVLLVSLALLLHSSHIVIKAAIKIARFTRLGEFVIGFILLAIYLPIFDVVRTMKQ